MQWLVLDEADQLMEMGFIADISIIFEELEKQKDSLQRGRRRSVLLSATLNEGTPMLVYSEYPCVHVNAHVCSERPETTCTYVNSVPFMLSLPPSPYPTSAVRELAGCSLHNPLYVDAAAEGSWRKGVIKQVEAAEALLSGKKRDQTPSQLQQFCSVVPCKLRLVALAACLLHHCNVRFSCHLSLCHCLCMYVCADVCVYIGMYACLSVLVLYLVD